MKTIVHRLSLASLLPLVLYLGGLTFVLPHIPSLALRIIFILYSLFIFWIVWRRVLSPERPLTDTDDRFFFWLSLGAIALLVITRFVPFLQYGDAPLGYDTGFYLKSIETTFSGLDGHRAVRSLIWVPFLWLGLPPIAILHGLYLLFQALTAGAVYMLGRALVPTASRRFNSGAALLFLFTASVPQFFAYWWMFYQMHLALAFFIVTIALLYRGSMLAAVTGAFVAALHPATFLPLGLTLAGFAVVDLLRAIIRWQRPRRETFLIILMGILALASIRFFGRDFLLVYLRGSVNQYGWLLTHYPAELKQQFTGLYITWPVLLVADAYLLPFVFLGILMLGASRIRAFRVRVLADDAGRLVLIFILLLIAGLFAVIPFIYQNRFLIILDIALLVFAAVSFRHFVVALRTDRLPRIVLYIFLFGFMLYPLLTAFRQEPQLYASERAEISAIATVAEPNDYAMSTESLYTPWVYAFSRRPTVDPGFLSWNRWDYPTWRQFWYGTSNARRHELLKMYDQPLYIFIGKRVPPEIPYRQFIENDPLFVRVSDQVWKYDPRAVSDEYVAILRAYEKEEQGI